MKTYNLKESLIQMDKDTDFKYTLTDLYEACQLDEKKKGKLAQYIDAKDPVGMNAMLSNEAGVMTENVSDDIPDEEMPEGLVEEGWTPDLTDCPECGDISFDPRKGRCTKCFYRESLEEDYDDYHLTDAIDDVMHYGRFLYTSWTDNHLVKTISGDTYEVKHKNNSGKVTVKFDMSDPTDSTLKFDVNGKHFETKNPREAQDFIINELEQVNVRQFDLDLDESFAEGDMVWVKPSNKPGRVVSVKGEYIEVEVMGGNDPDRRDVFYPEDLEKEVSINEDMLNEGPLALAGDLAGKAVGDAWKGVKNFAKGVRDTGKDVAKTVKAVSKSAYNDIKQSKTAAKARDAWRAAKESDTVDQFKQNYNARQDKRAKSDSKRTHYYKGKSGKSIGDKQDWKFVVNGKKLSYDQFMALPQDQRHQLVKQKKVKVLDLMGRETSFADHNKRLREYFLLEDFELEPDYSIYNLTDEQIEKVKFIENNLDTPTGYKAYYELEKEITDEGGCMDIFYDLSADFAWDNRFSVAITKLALADNRPDLADPEYLPGGAYAEYMDDPKYADVLLEDINSPNLEATLRAAAETKLAEMGYEDDFIDEYFGIKLEDTDDNRIKVTVWGELSYEESSELADVLNHIVAEEDPDAYFDHETSGRMAAYIRKDQSEDIPDEALVSEWSEKFNSCTTWEQLKDVYGEFYNIRDDLNNGTHRALYDIIDQKIDELKPVKEALIEAIDEDTAICWYNDSGAADDEAVEYCPENPDMWTVDDPRFVKRAIEWYMNSPYYKGALTEDADEAPATIYSMLDAADKYVDNDEYPEGASEEEIIEIAKNNPDCMKVTKWVDGQTGPDEVVWERPVDIWFVSQYEGGAEYEHAEGGYYYETLTHVDKETFKSKEAAQQRLAELADEARKEGEEVVAQNDNFFRIKTGKYIGDCEEYHVEAKEGAHASGRKVYEGLNEAILNEINSPEEKPYSASEIKKEIKSLTQNFTREKDNLKCGFKEENDAAVKELKKHYNNVTSEKHGQWFEITFSEPKKELKESNQFRDDNGKVNASKWYASKYPDDSVGIEQLDGIYLDDLIKDRKGIDHCDTQVRDRVNQQLDRYIPIKEDVQNTPVKLASEYFYDTIKNIQDAGWSEILSFAEDSGWISGSNIIIPAGTVMTLVDQNRHYDVYWVKTSAGDEFIPFNKDFTAESPLSFEDPAAEGANAYNVTFYMDSLDDNVMSGPHTTQKIYANSEEEAKKKLMDSSTDKYYIPTVTKVELVESVEASKEWEHKGKDGKIGRIRQSDGKGGRKPLTRDQAKEIAKFRGHEDDELYPVNESTNELGLPVPKGWTLDTSKEGNSQYNYHDDNIFASVSIYNSFDNPKQLRFITSIMDLDNPEKSKNIETSTEVSNVERDWDYALLQAIYSADKIISSMKNPVNESKSINEDRNKVDPNLLIRQKWQLRMIHRKLKPALRDKYGVMHVEFANVHGGYYFHFRKVLTDDEINDVLSTAESIGVGVEFYKNVNGTMSKRTPCSLFKVLPLDPDSYQESLTEAMTYTDVNGFLGDPGETYTMSQFRRMWQDKDNDPVMSGYDSFEEWVGETISQMDAHEEEFEVAPSGRGKLSTAIFIDTNGVMGTNGGKFTLNDLADYWEANRGSDPVLASYNGDWKKWLDDTIEQMEVSYDSSLFEESLTEVLSYDQAENLRIQLAKPLKLSDYEAETFEHDINNGRADEWKEFVEALPDSTPGKKEFLSMFQEEDSMEESFEDMLKDPEVQSRNAEYGDKMKAKHDKEKELAKEAKNWPDDKVLTYEEALALAKAYYSQGGDGFYETTEKYQFDDEVRMFGPMTVGQMKRDFGVFDSVAKDRMAEGLNLNESVEKYELLIEPYERYTQCPLVKKVFNTDSLAKVLEHIANKWMYGFDPIDRAYDEGWDCETREEAIEALQREYDKPYTQILIDELVASNGDGCGFIYYLKNLTTGDFIIDSGIEPEDEEEDLFESTSEETSDDYTLSIWNDDELVKDNVWSVSDALEFIHDNGGNTIKVTDHEGERIIWKDGKAVGGGFIGKDIDEYGMTSYFEDGEEVPTHKGPEPFNAWEWMYGKKLGDEEE